MKTVGYVGTVEVETRNVSRLWFSLTEDSQKDSWIKLGGVSDLMTLMVVDAKGGLSRLVPVPEIAPFTISI